MNQRYVVAAPVNTADGTPFWEVNDLAEDVNLAQIHKSVPEAENLANLIARRLNHRDQETPSPGSPSA